MKVLMLGWELPPHNAGGLGVECYRLCRALSKKGVDIEFILPYTADHSDITFMKINPAHSQTVMQVRSAGSVYDSFRYIETTGKISTLDLYGQVALYERSVERIVETSVFDVIHAHDWLTFRAAIRAKMRSGKPLIVHVHSLESDRAGQAHGGNPLIREIEELGLQMADRIVAVSGVTKSHIVQEYDIPEDKIEVVHNNLDITALLPPSNENEYVYLTRLKKQGYRVVMNVGRMTIQKGLPHLFQAFSIALQYAPKALLLIVGSGEQYHELIELAAELGIADHVLFTGFQRGKRWRDAFDIADLFVLPSPTEPFALTVLEAIGYGTPVLISKETGVAEVIRNALRVDYWDHNQMANKMATLLRHDGLRDELQTQAYRELERFSRGDSTADKLTALYQQQMEAVPA
ncbi:MAG TPA: glycosyltransferase family 4 protein [Candidatus Saccharimonadales bacterium]|nr:glycosyltransferase family 4 protein [Candidatus Saccharimonadales bacterium]